MFKANPLLFTAACDIANPLALRRSVTIIIAAASVLLLVMIAKFNRGTHIAASTPAITTQSITSIRLKAFGFLLIIFVLA
jgi:hypothetical protein